MGEERGWQRQAPAASPPGTIASTHCTGGWLGPRADLGGGGGGKSGPNQDSIPGPSKP